MSPRGHGWVITPLLREVDGIIGSPGDMAGLLLCSFREVTGLLMAGLLMKSVVKGMSTLHALTYNHIPSLILTWKNLREPFSALDINFVRLSDAAMEGENSVSRSHDIKRQLNS